MDETQDSQVAINTVELISLQLQLEMLYALADGYKVTLYRLSKDNKHVGYSIRWDEESA